MTTVMVVAALKPSNGTDKEITDNHYGWRATKVIYVIPFVTTGTAGAAFLIDR